MNDSTSSKEVNQYLTFVLDNEEYGLPIIKVRGIQGWEKTTPLPNSPDYVMGIINLRGNVVPIIDLRKRFGLEMVAYNKLTVVILVSVSKGDKEKVIGLVVDAVSDVYDIDAEEKRQAPNLGGDVGKDFISSLALVNEKLLIMLDVEKLIGWQENSSDDEGIETETALEIQSATSNHVSSPMA